MGWPCARLPLGASSQRAGHDRPGRATRGCARPALARPRLSRRVAANAAAVDLWMPPSPAAPAASPPHPARGPPESPRASQLSWQPVATRSVVDEDAHALPLYTCLDTDVLTPASTFAYYEALRSGLRALRSLGVAGVCVDVWWGLVEGAGPRRYDWSAYRQLLALIRDEGFTAQVVLRFDGTDACPLPRWVAEVGAANPDIWFTDRSGARATTCVSFGVDHVPALAGRTGLQVRGDLMGALADGLGGLLGGTVTDVVVGLGPGGVLQYPAHGGDRRWAFPGVGEFQCYDRYLLSGLRACAVQVNAPAWGLGGPHDAGAYTSWPHQTGFFAQYGNWQSPYGRFFLQWYADMLAAHADAVLGLAVEKLQAPLAASAAAHGAAAAAAASPHAQQQQQQEAPALWLPPSHVRAAHAQLQHALASSPHAAHSPHAHAAHSHQYYHHHHHHHHPHQQQQQHQPPAPAVAAATQPRVRLHAKLPSVHWWYNTAARAAELTAGVYNPMGRDGYVPLLQVLSKHGVSARLAGAELRNAEAAAPQQACCDPERQLAQWRTAASALHVGVGLESGGPRFDEAALGRLEAAAFDASTHQGIELQPVRSLVFNRMCDAMFEPTNWGRFKEWVRRVRARSDAAAVAAMAPGGGGGGDAAVAAADGAEA